MSESIWDRLIRMLGVGGGLGLIPFAPGTWGTLLGFPMAWVLLKLPFYGALGLWGIASLLGVYVAGRSAQLLGSNDPAAVVIDEYLAFAGLLLFLPHEGVQAIWAFLAFRFFDVIKPFPISWIDRHVKGGWGIMADDWAAALFAGLLLKAMHFGGVL